MNPLASEYSRARAVSRDTHIANDRTTFTESLAYDGLQLPANLRIYTDFYVPQVDCEHLERAMKAIGYEILYVSNSDPAFLHTRCEAEWTMERLRAFTTSLVDLGLQHNAGYDGSFIVSPQNDDEQ